MGHLQIFSILRFFVRVFCSTPKNKREFAGRLSFGRKFSKNKKLVQYTEHQQLTFKDNYFIM